MIAHIKGKVSEKFTNALIVDVGGVGYEIQVASHEYDSSNLGDEVTFYTYHYVREQAQELFGFSTLMAKRLFELLITVQGVGPKAALAILSIANYEDVQSAIARSDSAYITQASGVGKRTAERVVVDLSSKVGLPSASSSASTANINISGNDEALEALMALGFNLVDASTALAQVRSDLPTSERIKLALKNR